MNNGKPQSLRTERPYMSVTIHCKSAFLITHKLSNEQWQALIALHRTLLHEHHDFFLASQHPSSSPALRRSATKYIMPARMWRREIHNFLDRRDVDYLIPYIAYLASCILRIQ
jgi:hypothetical protein